MRALVSTAVVGVFVLAGCVGCGRGSHATTAGSSIEALAPRTHVLGGTPIGYAAFPSLAFVLNRKGPGGLYQCTGTVVAPRLVLTAGHCAGAPSGFQVFTGNWEDGRQGGAQVSAVSGVIVYPAYATTRADDAALLVLSKPTRSPPALLASRIIEGQEARLELIGWQSHWLRRPVKALALDLVSADVVARNEQCDPGNTIAEDLCLEGDARKAGACPGDSGGPVVSAVSGRDVEIGIATIGIRARHARCGDRTAATRVALIAPWIRRWIRLARVSEAAHHT